MRKVIIHYHRSDQEYEPWGVWLWPEGYGGTWVNFSESDYFGQVAICQVSKEHERLGFVIRGASWEKDIDQDRFIEDYIGDTAEVWLMAGDPEIYLAPPAHLRDDVRVFAEIELTIHYYRYDRDYTGWNLWVWEQEQGRKLEFIGSDEFGIVARIKLRQQTDAGSLGFVLRQSVLADGWAEKDGSMDRYIPFYRLDAGGKLDIWLMQDDPRIYYQAEDVKREPCLTQGLLDDLNTIRVTTYLPVQGKPGETWGFKLFQAEEEIALKEVRPCYPPSENRRCFFLETKEPLDLRKSYYLKHETHGKLALGFGEIFSSTAFQREFHYSGSDLGVSYSPKETSFKVWAPTAKNIALIIYDQGEGGEGGQIPLKPAEKGVWSITVKGDLEGRYYNYLVTHQDTTFEVVDPYARATGVNGLRGQVVDLSKTNPPGFEMLKWLPVENPVDAILYEVHVRDFSSSKTSGIKAQGQYLGLIEENTKTAQGVITGLDHLKDLGITHVHLLPIFDFATVDEKEPESSYNWGYDPLNYNVPEGSYSRNPHDGRVRIRELKTMIQGLNQVKIGTIMDVVYNHTFHSLASSFHKLVPGYYYRHNQNGSFSNGSGCGNELADERSMVRKFIVDSVTYWAREYKLAGFRFDLMGLHHIETMQAVRRALDLLNPQMIIYGEGWAAASSTLPEQKRAMKENAVHFQGIASFSNDLRDGIKGHVFHTSQGGFIQGQGYEETLKFGIVGAIQHPQIDYSKVLYSRGPWAIAPSQSVAYAEAHDNLTLWDKLLCTTPPLADDERKKMMKLAHAILLTSQGIPFIHAGQDFARTKGGDPNSYQSPDHVNQLDWERKGDFLDLFEYTKGLIKMRKAHGLFRLTRGPEVREMLQFIKLPFQNMVGYVLGPGQTDGAVKTIAVLFNSNKTPVEVEIGPGPWEVLANDKWASGELGILTGPKVWVEALSPLILSRREREC